MCCGRDRRACGSTPRTPSAPPARPRCRRGRRSRSRRRRRSSARRTGRSRTTRTGSASPCSGSRAARSASRPCPSCRRSRSGSGRRRRRRCRAASACRRRGRPAPRWSAAGSTPLGVGGCVASSRRTCGAFGSLVGCSTSCGDVRRHELAAVRDHRVEARHLQRRHLEVALADRELDRVARLPDPVDLAVLRAAERRPRHSGVGTSPALSGPTSIPVSAPKPKREAQSWSGWPRLAERL